MANLFTKGYATEVKVEECTKAKGVWYMPHHGVLHPTKGKQRVVFDCAATFQSQSLNKALLSGPDLTNSVVGVLTRFRKELIPFTADIESMFYQVKVQECQQSYLRFLWWPEGNVANDLKEYQMTVHVFGATSSPGCANFALRQTAEDFVSYNPETRETLLRNFYVDDLLHSTPTISSAQVLFEGASKLCQDGGFNLAKFLCPEVDVLSVLPDEKVSSSIEKVRLSHEQTVERALDIIWCIENDTLGFHVTLKDVPLTRRGILSSISSIFDPLGIASPFLLRES